MLCSVIIIVDIYLIIYNYIIVSNLSYFNFLEKQKSLHFPIFCENQILSNYHYRYRIFRDPISHSHSQAQTICQK
jgi:secreted Zn-dependent insulinase-like peptidase